MALTVKLKFPTFADFWPWLAKMAYRRCMQRAPASNQKPVGIPGNRDPLNPCTGFEPRPRKNGDWGACQSDGHYLCRECCHWDGEEAL